MTPDCTAGTGYIRLMAFMVVAAYLSASIFQSYEWSIGFICLALLFLGAACNDRFCAIERRSNVCHKAFRR